ncbi:putative Heat shock protein 70 family [Helianthus annuus]|nr:putative Heat shock protein 70 family [Helianthus annuus]KAJ0782349.1 putative Heat shock protein 70 family [Helianthus annuus]KAJ0946907.1 putative Heat shock protein 70 family [Helianthus annuus]KAJ0955937.1 putative Heat shock protein 70 family [Helianthus annuus]
MIVTNNQGRLSNEEIDKMLKDAEKYRLEDQEFKKKVSARNALERYIYDVETKIKTIKGAEKNIHKNDLQKLEYAIENASQFLNSRELASVEEYETMLNQLQTQCVCIISQYA